MIIIIKNYNNNSNYEPITHLISECNEVPQKEYKTRRTGWPRWKKLKFDCTNKCYMQNPASVLENETHQLLWDVEIQMDHQILARRADIIIINKGKENLQNCGLCCEKKNKYLGLGRELKKQGNMKVMIIPICSLGTVTNVLIQELEDL